MFVSPGARAEQGGRSLYRRRNSLVIGNDSNNYLLPTTAPFNKHALVVSCGEELGENAGQSNVLALVGSKTASALNFFPFSGTYRYSALFAQTAGTQGGQLGIYTKNDAAGDTQVQAINLDQSQNFTSYGATFSINGTAAQTSNVTVVINGRNVLAANAAGAVTPYNQLVDTAGNGAIFLGGGGSTPDHSNYYRNTTHFFGDINQVNIMATFQNGTSGIRWNQYTTAGLLQVNSSGVMTSTALAGGQFVSQNNYASTQTITIPAGATRAFLRMKGASGGLNIAATTTAAAAAGQGGFLEKYLTGLTPGNTLTFTLGAAGGAGTAGNGNATAGGTTTLASGTQTISTLTCNGGGAANETTGGAAAVGTGGTASGGDRNITGSPGMAFSTGGCTPTVLAFGTPSEMGNPAANNVAPAANTGVAAYNNSTTSTQLAGATGILQAWWFS
jgi:hypothetical protein